MDDRLEALYRRAGRRYLQAYVAFDIATALVWVVAAVAATGLIVELSFGQALRMVAVAAIAGVGPVAWGAWRGLRASQALLEWLENPDRDAGDAWKAAVRFPLLYSREVGWRVAVFGIAPTTAYFVVETGAPAYAVPAGLGAGLVLFSYGVTFHYFLLEWLLAPVLRDIAQRLPVAVTVQAVRLSLGAKLLAALPLINLISAFVAAFLAEDRPTWEDVGVDLLLALGIALSTSLVLTLLVARSIVGPVQELVAATRQVASGRLDARAAVTTEDELGMLAASFNDMMDGLRERATLERAMGSYVAPDVARRVLMEGTRLEAAQTEATMMFVDICGFTAFSERVTPHKAVSHLNEFFELVVPIVLRHGGYPNKFVGDGLLAVFGAPAPLEDHADRAVECAEEVVTAVDGRYARALAVGIGINSGWIVAGTVGGGGRLEFMLIGDPVNVAARVERLTRETGDAVLLTEATRTLLARWPGGDLEPRGEIAVKGKAQPLRLYASRGAGPLQPAAGRSAPAVTQPGRARQPP